MSDISALLYGFADAAAKVAASPKVYPGYIVSRIKRALLVEDPELRRPDNHIIETVGDIETVGSCRYRLTVIDHHGSQYRITVELVDAKRQAKEAQQ